MIEVIGAGFGRNGTDSLRKALELLGLGPCHHMAEVIENPKQLSLWRSVEDGKISAIKEALVGFRSQVDWPGAAYWETLAEIYPASKVILSIRDPDEWFDSVQATIVPFINSMSVQNENEHLKELANWSARLIARDIFEDRLHDRAYATEVYRAHTSRVISTIPKERLLVFRVSDGWEPLCNFLGREIPSEVFPKTNSTSDFRDNNKI